MDRFSRSLALSACGFGLILAGTGCRMTRPEVPPGRPYASDGRQRPAIGFSSDPHPVDGSATANFVPDSPGSSKLAQGVGGAGDRPDMSPLLDGGTGRFGGPGTSGRDGAIGRTTPAGDEAVLPAGSPNLARPSIDPTPRPAADQPDAPPANMPSSTLPPDAAPAAAAPPAGSQVIQGDDAPGRMGRASDFPNPN